MSGKQSFYKNLCIVACLLLLLVSVGAVHPIVRAQPTNRTLAEQLYDAYHPVQTAQIKSASKPTGVSTIQMITDHGPPVTLPLYQTNAQASVSGTQKQAQTNSHQRLALDHAFDAPAASVQVSGTSYTSQAIKPWTFAVYMGSDTSDTSNLSRQALDNLHSMGLGGGTTANMNVVALLDLINQPTHYYEIDDANANPTQYLTDKTPSTFNGKNVDTGNPQTFIDFMAFVKQNYPAQHYAVVLWSHGGGWKGIEADDTSSSLWTMAKLRTALDGGRQQLGVAKYDLLLTDACFMAQYEVAFEVAPYIDVLVASEEEVSSSGFPYQNFLPTLQSTPNITNAQFASTIVDAYSTFYGSGGEGNYPAFTLSALQFGAPFDAFASNMLDFGSSLLAISNTQAGELLTARRATQQYHDPDFADLGDFVLHVRNDSSITDATVRTSATALLTTLTSGSGFVIREAHGAASTNSRGISIEFPAEPGKKLRGSPTTIASGSEESPIAPGYDQLQVKQTPWYGLLLGLETGNYSNTSSLPAFVPQFVPPPAAASTDDVVFSSVLNNQQVDLSRIKATPSPDDPLLLFSDGSINTYPRWSPDGKFVAYISNSGTTTTNSNRNIFIIKADGSSPNTTGSPQQLTQYQINCPGGPGTGTKCIFQQVVDLSWLGDNSGLLYTLVSSDLTSIPVSSKKSIHLIGSNGAYETQLAPNQLFGNVNGFGDADFASPDLNAVGGQIRYLLFSYNTPSTGNYNEKFRDNNLGFIDLTSLPLDYTDLYGIFLNDPQKSDLGNFLKADYPVWRPGSDDITFLYNRRGDPPIIRNFDWRTPPAVGVWERQNKLYPKYGDEFYPTYDIGRVLLYKSNNAYRFQMETSIWADPNAQSGSGVNFRPSWQPVYNSSNLVASYSRDSGFSYDIALFGNIADDTRTNDTFDLLTTDGSSYLPSWGIVTAADVRARLQVSPRYLEPGAKSYYYLSGGGFQPNEQVQLVDVTDGGNTVIGTVTADTNGAFTKRFTLTLDMQTSKAHYFVARGTVVVPELGGIKTSNQDVLVPISHVVYLPIVIR